MFLGHYCSLHSNLDKRISNKNTYLTVVFYVKLLLLLFPPSVNFVSLLLLSSEFLTLKTRMFELHWDMPICLHTEKPIHDILPISVDAAVA